MAIRKLPFSPMVGSTGFRKTYRHWSPPVIEEGKEISVHDYHEHQERAIRENVENERFAAKERKELRTSTLRNGLAESGF